MRMTKLFKALEARPITWYGDHEIPRIHSLAQKIRRYATVRNIAAALLLIALLGICLAAAIFYWPRTISFSYSKTTCFTNPVLLPELTVSHPSSSFDAKLDKTLSIGNYTLYSQRMCIVPIKAATSPASEKIRLSVKGINFVGKTIRVLPGKQPALKNSAAFDAPLRVKEPLVMIIDSADIIFAYRLSANGKHAACDKKDALLTCNTALLQLAQSKNYEVTLERIFNNQPAGVVSKKSMTTVDPVHVSATSIAAGQTLYDIRQQMTITLDRAIKSYSGIKLQQVVGETRKDIAVLSSLAGNIITINFNEPLARSAEFTLSLSSAAAPDGGYLLDPLSLAFSTSGGPKVLNANIGSYKVSPSASIALTFDSAIIASQPLSEFIKLEVGGSAVAATITRNGRVVTIDPAGILPTCTSFTVKVLDGIKNEAGIAGGSAWQYKARTICQKVFSIGTSVQGRSITAYSFGSGASKIIFVGTTHGNEKSSTYLLNRWIDALEAGMDRIPANRTVIVVPNLNPDGYAVNKRTNANNIDLNRNFPANDWKPGVTMPDQSYLPTGGGTTSLSEPESQAIANYVLSQNPRLVLTYHASGGIVSPNDSGDSQAIAVVYGQKSSVGYLSNSGTAGFFAYDTTGAFEAWLHDKHSIPTLLIELLTKTNDEFSGHQSALWYVAELP